MKNKITYLVLGVLLLALWQYFGSSNQTVRLLLSSPSLIAEYIGENHVALLKATKITLVEAVAGLTIAAMFSFTMMFACFYIPKMMEFVLPIMIVSQVIPLIVLAPFFIILMGIGLWSKITMAALMCFFPIFVNFAQGYKSIGSNVHEMMLVYNASTWARIRNVYLPLSLPNIMAGLRISATLAVIGAIVAEFTGAEVGLGRNLYISALRLEPEMMMSSLVLSALLGLSLYGLMRAIENRIKWMAVT